MEIEFFNKDAREIFLPEKSVDLFISRFPSYRDNVKDYGGDVTLQLQNAYDIEEFFESIFHTVRHMEHALKDSGSIVLIFTNGPRAFRIFSDISKKTELFPNRIIFWNYEKWYGEEEASGDGTSLIMHITRLHNLPYEIKGLESFVVKNDFGPSIVDVAKYKDVGFMGESLPQDLTDLLVKVFSKEGDTVADILGGSGTVAISALKNNRKAIYNDSSIEQFELAKKRVSDTIDITTKEIDMTKEETMQLMLKSINDDNRDLCQKNGMSEADAEAQISQSQPALQHIVANMYDRMKDAGALA